MSPKVTDEQFLVECIKSSKNKLEVDYDAVAAATGLSVGGSRNKYGFIMKRIEAERSAVATDGSARTPAPTPKTSKKRAKATNGEGEDGSPAKKPRSTKKKAAAKVEETGEGADAEAKETGEGADAKVKEELKDGEDGNGTDDSVSA